MHEATGDTVAGVLRLEGPQRVALAALADVLIPESGRMPKASDALVHEKWIDRVLRARPDLSRVLGRALDEAGGREPHEVIAHLQQHAPEDFRMLTFMVAGAYYMNPKIRRLIGYPGQKANPPYPDEADYYLDGGLLDPVVARGHIFRVPPTST